jgi:hypothetical protein
MDFGSEMLSVDHADISKRDIGNNRCISWAKRKFFQSRDCVCLFFFFLTSMAQIVFSKYLVTFLLQSPSSSEVSL